MFQHLKQYYRRADQHKALNLLDDSSRFPALREFTVRDLRLFLYRIPSFEPHVSWSLFTDSDHHFTIRRVRWDTASDYHLEIGDPTIYGADSIYREEDITPWLLRLDSISIPAFDISHSLGIDGTTFGLRRSGFSQSAEVSWWCQPPDAWSDLAAWHHGFIDYIESAAPEHTNQLRTGTKQQSKPKVQE